MFFNQKFNKGFSLLEVVIAIILLIMIMAILVTITLGGIKNGVFAKHLADVTVLTSQKATDLFNSATFEIKSIPSKQNTIGSIDPSQPLAGYVDYLNESGCIIKNLSPQQIKFDEPIEPTKDAATPQTNKTARGLGDIGSDDTNTQPSLDCSRSLNPTNSNSLIVTYRRQWTIVKNSPNPKDITISVILVNQSNNSIIRSETLVKVDGTSRK